LSSGSDGELSRTSARAEFIAAHATAIQAPKTAGRRQAEADLAMTVFPGLTLDHFTTLTVTLQQNMGFLKAIPESVNVLSISCNILVTAQRAVSS
jgi:hypothetical protein